MCAAVCTDNLKDIVGTSDCESVNKSQCIKFVADNVDHNTRTIDGMNTFHGMGIIGVFHPAVTYNKAVPRQSVTLDHGKSAKSVKVIFFKGNAASFHSLKFSKLPDIQPLNEFTPLDVLWKISWRVTPPRPLWSGMMQSAQEGTFPGRSSVIFLPVIDMNPSDLSCVLSTLQFVCQEAAHHSVTPILTVDQPLW